MDPDVLVNFLFPPSAARQPDPLTNIPTDFQVTINVPPVAAAASVSTYSHQSHRDPRKRNPSEWETGNGRNVPIMQQPAPQAAATNQPWCPPAINVSGEYVLLRSLLRYGRISDHLEDLQLWDPQFSPPDYIKQSLFQKHGCTPVTGVTIVSEKSGQLKCSVDPKLVEISMSRKEGIQIASNETLLLKTCIRNGRVSFLESDVHFRFGNFQIPQNIVDGLKEEYRSTPCGDLYIISDEKWNLRSTVKIGTINRMRTFANRHGF